MATTYSNRSNAIRAAKKAGYTKDQVDVMQGRSGRWYWTPATSEAEKEVNERLEAQYGYTHCPECGEHLTNGVSDFETIVDSQDGNMNKAYALQKKQFACMACDAEWGNDALAPADEDHADDTPKKPGKRTYRRTGESSYPDSTVESPVAIAWAIYDELVAAKGVQNIVRKEFIAEAVGAGINQNTASTQFTAWKKGRIEGRS